MNQHLTLNLKRLVRWTMVMAFVMTATSLGRTISAQSMDQRQTDRDGITTAALNLDRLSPPRKMESRVEDRKRDLGADSGGEGTDGRRNEQIVADRSY